MRSESAARLYTETRIAIELRRGALCEVSSFECQHLYLERVDITDIVAHSASACDCLLECPCCSIDSRAFEHARETRCVDLIVATFVQLALGVRSVKVVIDRHDRRILVTAK